MVGGGWRVVVASIFCCSSHVATFCGKRVVSLPGVARRLLHLFQNFVTDFGVKFRNEFSKQQQQLQQQEEYNSWHFVIFVMFQNLLHGHDASAARREGRRKFVFVQKLLEFSWLFYSRDGSTG